jgi:hypothetical protein
MKFLNKKIFFGPMSKLIVECVRQHPEFGFIPSRRQIDLGGGYVNNWTMRGFSKYVGESVICRDHAGPDQGMVSDDGISSMKEDVRWVDVIHIDPWKKYKELEDGLQYTVEAIKGCRAVSDRVRFEVGTEQAIRKFHRQEFDELLAKLHERLTSEEFESIVYAVVQGGTGLNLANRKNVGEYAEERLKDMCRICEKYNKLSKEHNGDYFSDLEISNRFRLGLDSINIAPEIAQIETKAIYDIMDDVQRESYYNLCVASRKWEKWLNKDIDDYYEFEVIITCGHYLFSDPDFIKIKESVNGVDDYSKSCIVSYLERMKKLV